MACGTAWTRSIAAGRVPIAKRRGAAAQRVSEGHQTIGWGAPPAVRLRGEPTVMRDWKGCKPPHASAGTPRALGPPRRAEQWWLS
jgi:hypothetical protein